MENKIRAGVGKTDITAEPGAVIGDLLTEKAKRHIPSEFMANKIAIDDPLYAKALVLEQGDCRLALITVDATAVGCRTTSQNILDDSADDFIPNLRRCLSGELGIPPQNVSVCASHTHPPGRTLCSDQEQLRRTVDAVRQAIGSLTPVVVGAGSIRDVRLTFNRTSRLKSGLHGFGRMHDEEVASLGPVDTEIGVIRIDRVAGPPLAVVYNFASHILYNSPRDNISAGFPGIASGLFETALGNGAMAFFIQGAGGDVSCISTASSEKINPRSAEETGLLLAQSVLKAHRGIRPSSADIQVVSTTVDFPLRRDIPETIAALRRKQAELVASLQHLNIDFKMFLSLYLPYALYPEYPAHPVVRYLHADQTGDHEVPAMDRRNRAAIHGYLGNIRVMQELAVCEFKISTLAKHQEIIDALGTRVVAAEIQGIRIGGAVLITAPMEVLTEIGLKVKKMSPFPNTCIASNANGYFHYACPASYYPLGSYEATECLLAPEWEPAFYGAVREVFNRLQAAGAV